MTRAEPCFSSPVHYLHVLAVGRNKGIFLSGWLCCFPHPLILSCTQMVERPFNVLIYSKVLSVPAPDFNPVPWFESEMYPMDLFWRLLISGERRPLGPVLHLCFWPCSLCFMVYSSVKNMSVPCSHHGQSCSIYTAFHAMGAEIPLKPSAKASSS